ncbi:MAG: hypothetical protein PHW15_03010 [Patescibacteria group bacterium]|jgi:hypothetical protein|nr:hypothetical protein [Patescibacteria group bacterium]MDD5173039.1 hypothetical protein [Patescibacteria group bacterium]
MRQENQILDDEINFRIRRIKEIYYDFEKEINLLKEKQNQIINQALEKIDKQKIQDALNKLKNK